MLILPTFVHKYIYTNHQLVIKEEKLITHEVKRRYEIFNNIS